MDDTPNLTLPYILAAQSQKHVTHNEAIRALDCLVQLTVLDRDLAAPPVAPAEGDRYLVAASPSGAWAGQAGKIAAFQDAAWLFYAPKEGWIAWVADENTALVYDGAAWLAMSSGGGASDHGALTGLADDDHPQYLNTARGDVRYTPVNPLTLGVNATADATNKLAVSSAASLFNHIGSGGHQIKINKAAAADTASFLFQTAFSGRAELGTTGDDDFHFKVSANGSTYNEAILINRTTGAVTFPNTALGTGTVTNVATGTGLTGGPITATGTIALANMAAATLKGNNTGAAAAPADLTAAQVKALLAIAASDVSGLAAIATSGSASNLIAGTVPAAQMAAHTGDVTSPAGSNVTTIAANAVSNAKAAQMAANTLKGNNTGATANAGDLTVAQAKTLLAIAASDVSGLAAIATSGSASNLIAGTVPAAQMPAHSGDVTSAAGSVALTLTDNAVSMAKLADAPAWSLLLHNAATTGDPSYAKISDLPDRSAFGTGDKILIEESTGELRRIDFADLPGAGGGLSSAYGAITDGTTTASAASADTFKLRSGSGIAVTVASNDPTHGDNAIVDLASAAAGTIKGNATASAAVPIDLSASQVAALLRMGDFEYANRSAPLAFSDYLHISTPTGGFINAAISAGTIAVAAATSFDGNHPGVVLLRSSTTANSGYYSSLPQTIRPAGGERFDVVFRTPAALTTTTVRLGLHDTLTSADAVDGCYLELPATGAIVGKTSSNSTRSTTATIATLAVNTWYHARIQLNAAATAVDFTIFSDSGTQLGTAQLTTNIPIASGREVGAGVVATNSGTVASDLINLDYMSVGVRGRNLTRGALN